MPIGAIISQPVANALRAGYRPVSFRVSATATDNNAQPPVVYCDIYFNSIFYKTISKTQYDVLNLANTEWLFDIQDAAQEYLTKYLGNYGEAAIVEATPIITPCFCRFRSSGFDSNGFIQSEGTEPVQGTSSSDPVSGTGSESVTFFILNATLQHEDNQDIATHLSYSKRRTWAANTYPLSHRPDNYKLCLDDSDIFPIVHEGEDLACLVLNYKNKGQSTWNSTTNCAVLACPLPANLEIFVEDNDDGNQTFTFDWDAVMAPTAQLDIQSRPSGSTGDWTSHVGSIIPTRNIILPIGLYDFRLVGVGECAGTPGPLYEGYGIDTCIPVVRTAFEPDQPATDFPDAQVGVPYDYYTYFSGTPPIAIANAFLPSWMTATVVGMTIHYTGTPQEGDETEALEISHDVTNCSGKSSVHVESIIAVAAPDASTFTNNSEATFGYKIVINGTLVSVGSIGPLQTIEFVAPELALSEGLELIVYTSTLLMTTCTAQSNAVNIPMEIDTSGPGTNNIANNLSNFAINNGIQIAVS